MECFGDIMLCSGGSRDSEKKFFLNFSCRGGWVGIVGRWCCIVFREFGIGFLNFVFSI